MRQTLFFLALFLPCTHLIAGDKQEVTSQLLSIFYDLWKDSAFGKDPARTERAAWIVDTGSNDLACTRWPLSRERNREYWHGPIPNRTVAHAHTHTAIADPRPAKKDIELSRRTGLPLYIISGSGIWVVTPDGKITQTGDSGWYRALKR